MAEREQALQAVEAARDSLDLIGEGDWTPQDAHCARLIHHVIALEARLQAAEEALRRISSEAETQREMALVDVYLADAYQDGYRAGWMYAGEWADEALAAAASVPANKETPDDLRGR